MRKGLALKKVNAVKTGLGREERHQARSELVRSEREPFSPVVRTDTFIRATRDTGYKNTAMAIAELVDNATQALASRVEVIINKDESGTDALKVAVVDNGHGMDETTLLQALCFGGSTHFNDRRGQGRFGMGLPNASVSQAKRVDLYTWSSTDLVLTTFIDIDALVSGRLDGIPWPRRTTIPAWLKLYTAEHGTAVVWTKCDRIQYRRVGTFTHHLHRELGRIFRRFINQGLLIHVNGEVVEARDPIRILPSPPGGIQVKELPPLIFSFNNPTRPGHTSDVEVRFTLLPVENWSELPANVKRSYGISNGATVSILRAQREIAFGWYLLGTKKRENYDDWWRCEIAFEPELDDLFGVTHSKQAIRPTATLIAELAPSLESQARKLNREVRERFEALKEMKLDAVRLAGQLHHKLLPPNRPLSSSKKNIRVRDEQTRYSIKYENSPSPHFLEARHKLGMIQLIINCNHPFYRALYAPLQNIQSSEITRSFDLWLLAFARALSYYDSPLPNDIPALLSHWSDAAALLLEER